MVGGTEGKAESMRNNTMPTGPEGEFVREQLRALGSEANISSTDDRVYEALVKAVRGAKQMPSLSVIYKSLDMPDTTTRSALRRLASAGRVLNPAKGIWIPVVVPEKKSGAKK